MPSVDQTAFNDHFNKMMFIKRLQEKEGLIDKFLSGEGVLAHGGGMAHGLGLGSGGGLNDGGFKNRRPAVQTEMISTLKDDNVIDAEANVAELKKNEKNMKEGDDDNVRIADKTGIYDKDITFSGVTKSVWNKKQINTIYKYSERPANEYNDLPHDPKNFTGTTSKSVIFEKDGKILKYKSIS